MGIMNWAGSVALTSWLASTHYFCADNYWRITKVSQPNCDYYSTDWLQLQIASTDEDQECAPLTVVCRYSEYLIHELPLSLSESKWMEADWEHTRNNFKQPGFRKTVQKASDVDLLSLFLPLLLLLRLSSRFQRVDYQCVVRGSEVVISGFRGTEQEVPPITAKTVAHLTEMFSGSNGTSVDSKNVWETPIESHFLKTLIEWRVRTALEEWGARVRRLPLQRHLPPNIYTSWITFCGVKWNTVVVPPLESSAHAFLHRVQRAHVLRRPHCFCTRSTRSPSHLTPCIPWLLFCRACCLYIAFLPRDATLRTILKSMQLHTAHFYDAFTPCRSFLKHRITFKSAFFSVH